MKFRFVVELLLFSLTSPAWLIVRLSLTAPTLFVSAFGPPIAFAKNSPTSITRAIAAERRTTTAAQIRTDRNELTSLLDSWKPDTTSSPRISVVAGSNSQQKESTPSKKHRQFKHVMAILSVPYTSIDRIANEAILETAIKRTDKLSVVLRCEGSRKTPSLVSLRRYVGEIYSQLWDMVMDEFPQRGVPDVVVFPQNMPNTAPEGWIEIQPDLDCVCSHDTLCGWVSEEAMGRGLQYLKQGSGRGGLKEHVQALNAERKRRKLPPLVALQPDHWPLGAQLETSLNQRVIFLDDEPGSKSALQQALELDSICSGDFGDDDECEVVDENSGHFVSSSSFLGGAPVSANDLFESVAVGGTFDGLHFGHRKLLTLAISSVQPLTGRLLVGITVDEMLQSKTCAEDILKYKDRAATVRNFFKRLSPGCLNRIKLVPITDKFGPPGKPDQFFDALILSHEVLDTGFRLNEHRASLGLNPLYLLCTRRTEARGMSSTALRKARSQLHLDEE